MKNLLLALAVISASVSLVTTASADIIRPPNIKTTNVTGAKAEKLYESMKVQELRGDSLRTMFSVYKVARTGDGLRQVVCEKQVYSIPKKRVFRCTTQESLDGRPVPAFVPHRRVG